MLERRLTALVLAGVLTALAVAGVAGHSRFSGPVLFGIGQTTHGVHRDDLAVLALYLLGLLLCWRLARR